MVLFNSREINAGIGNANTAPGESYADTLSTPLKIHWRLCQGGDAYNRSRSSMAVDATTALPQIEKQLAFANMAEKLGIDSLLVDFGYNKPDSIVLSTALGLMTEKIKLIIACRSGVISPTYFVQQLNTLSSLIPGRLSLNVVAGHSPGEQKYYGDFMPHDQRFSRTEEYLTICREFWNNNRENQLSTVDFTGKYYHIENARLKTPFVDATVAYTKSAARRRPELFIAGSSIQAQALTKKVGDTWISVAEAPKAMRNNIEQMRSFGKEVAIRLSIICRPTKEEAIAAAYRLIRDSDRDETEKKFVSQSDSVGINRAYKQALDAENYWLTECLWNGAVKTHGAPAIALVGDAEEIAAAILEYKQLGVSQMILSGWPQYQEMCFFGKYVMPLIRENEDKYFASTYQRMSIGGVPGT
jgi:alkanesulfonate monooxygenase